MGQARNWTQEEYDYLKEHWGYTSIGTIAKKLNRSVEGIKIKASRLHLGAFLESCDFVSLARVIEAFGKSYSWTKNVWEREGLPLHHKRVNNNSFLMVNIEEFWEWAEKHKELLNFERLEKNILGKEPAWVDSARKANYQGNRKRKPWTSADDTLIANMVKRGTYHISEIAERLGRSEGATRRRIYDIGLELRPIKHKPRDWCDEDIKLMLTLRAEGNSWEVIGKKLGRSGSSCRGKFEMLNNPEYNKRKAKNSRSALKDCFMKDQCVHFRRALGCEMGGTDCDSCEHFQRIQSGEKVDTGWNNISKCVTASKILEDMYGGEKNSIT